MNLSGGCGGVACVRMWVCGGWGVVGRPQLLRPVVSITAPAGATIEICYSQALIDGKASPYHPLCGRYAVDGVQRSRRVSLPHPRTHP